MKTDYDKYTKYKRNSNIFVDDTVMESNLNIAFSRINYPRMLVCEHCGNGLELYDTKDLVKVKHRCPNIRELLFIIVDQITREFFISKKRFHLIP